MARKPPNTPNWKDWDYQWHERGQVFFCVPHPEHLKIGRFPKKAKQ